MSLCRAHVSRCPPMLSRCGLGLQCFLVLPSPIPRVADKVTTRIGTGSAAPTASRAGASETLNHCQRPVEADLAHNARHDQLARQLAARSPAQRKGPARRRPRYRDSTTPAGSGHSGRRHGDQGIPAAPHQSARQIRLQHAVVKTRAAVAAYHDGPLAQARPVRCEPHPGNVKVETYTAQLDAHGVTLRRQRALLAARRAALPVTVWRAVGGSDSMPASIWSRTACLRDGCGG